MNVSVPSLPKIMSHRPSLTLKNPFASSAANASPGPAANGTSASAKGKGREGTSPTNRRSSLANLADMTSQHLGGLSVKFHNKLPLPVVSYRPAQMDRRESESIFEAHEEFEGLPGNAAPMGAASGLGAIAEDASDGDTPGFHTPRATTPTPASLALPQSPRSGPTTPNGDRAVDSPFSPRHQYGAEFRS
jgi:hypothetical protein